MGSKYTKRYTAEFKRDAIALVDSTGRTVTEVARELGVSPESLRNWYRQAKLVRRVVPRRHLCQAEATRLPDRSGAQRVLPPRCLGWEGEWRGCARIRSEKGLR